MADKQTERELTGYPSLDKPWLKYYKENAYEDANNIPKGKIVWDVIEENLNKHLDIPAIEYFGRNISRKEFIDNVYLWAKAFKQLGVKKNEVVAYYGPFIPDVCFMLFGLNIIGACPYFLKLAISAEALEEETRECRFAIVFDQMWDKVSDEFSKDRFEKVIVARINDAMSAPKKQIVGILSGIKSKTRIPKGEKYISVSEARKLASKFSGEIRVPFEENRNAFITSSSGTTVGGEVKGVIATNESVIAQAYSTLMSDTPYRAGDRTLNHFPPTASTSLNSLCFVGLISGATILIDPRVSEDAFYHQLIEEKPSMCINTGSLWETFFNRVEAEAEKGKKFDFSYARGWMIGGEGTTVEKMKKWNSIVQKYGGNGLFGGYGLSETFSGICIDRTDFRGGLLRKCLGIGVPQAGMDVGIFDKNGKELSYNQRGELWVRTKAAMKGYYNKPELTANTKVNGWIRTGDLDSIDENGFVYVWGRVKDAITLSSGKRLFLFDVENKIKENWFIDDAIVLEKKYGPGVNLVAHIVWSKNVKENEWVDHLQEINKQIREFEPEITLDTYAFHEGMLPYSATTLKKDKNKMAKQNDGYYQVELANLKRVHFVSNGDGGYILETA